jgi:diguanylate cyclase (GGDEF)-like protein
VARDQSRDVRHDTALQRHDVALTRDTTAYERDRAAAARDAAAAARDRNADERDAVARRAAGSGSERVVTGAQIILRAAADRRRAAADRARATAHRAEAARDREQAAHDRELAAQDRADATAERMTAALDALTGAWRRGPGLLELQREIDRAHRGETRLVVAYVDVDLLKAVNDSQGHGAGDAVLRRVVGVLQTRLRSYEPIIRLGGDEFLCALSGATIENARRRFVEIEAELAAESNGDSISVGLAELGADDSPTDLIERADAELLAARGPRRVSFDVQSRI